MEIIVNGIPAEIKKGSSFQYISENRSFSRSDGYSLAITFPIAGCSSNFEIFGHICRADLAKEKIIYDCTIRDKEIVLNGNLTVTAVDDVEIKAQFLEGRSAQNYDETFDDIYINELNIGEPIDIKPDKPFMFDPVFGYYGQTNYVALPWVNNTSRNMQNEYTFEGLHYTAPEGALSYQPFLMFIIKKIFSLLDYSIDISCFKKTSYWNLLICNTIPVAWDTPQFEAALPHWSVTQFIEEIENLFNVEFEIDHKHKSIKVEFAKVTTEALPSVVLDNVLDGYSVAVSKKDETNFNETANVSYAECSHNMWKCYVAQHVIDTEKEMLEYDTYADFYAAATDIDDRPGHKLGHPLDHVSHLKDSDTYMIMKCIGVTKKTIAPPVPPITTYNPIYIPVPINQFAPRTIEKDGGNNIELNIVPVWIDSIDTKNEKYGMFLDLGTTEGKASEEKAEGSEPDTPDPVKKTTIDDFQTRKAQLIIEGESDKDNEVFDKLYIAFWDGINRDPGALPCPIIDKMHLLKNWNLAPDVPLDFSLRLTDKHGVGARRNRNFGIVPKQKYTFKFLSKSMPNPRSIFYIHNKKYVCAKLTGEFKENGLSELITGEFFPAT